MRLLPSLSAAVVLAAAVAAPAGAFAGAEVVSGVSTDLSLEVGKGRLIRLDRPAKTIFVADPKIADVQVKSPTLVYLVGNAPGGTSLFAVDASEKIVANLGVTVGFDAARLEETIKRNAPDSDVKVSALNDALVLSGKVASPAQGEEILRMAARFVRLDKDGVDQNAHLINRLTVEAATQVNLRVRVVEVTKQAREVLGFNWESLGDVGGAVLGLATGNPVFKDVIGKSEIIGRNNGTNSLFAGSKDGDVNVLIDALKQKGLVTVLAEPNLTALSGEPASFLAGGEYPIPVPQGNDQISIEFKKYGVSLSFVATILDAGRISLNVRPEVSQLSDAGAITLNGVRVPALTTRRADTTVDLGSGQSFAIAGLLQRTTSEDTKKVPALGELPVLGQLFRSKEFQNNESELVIIVTPYLVKPVSQKLAMPSEPAKAAPVLAASDAAAPAAATAEKKG